jgi:hypothetical protein
VHRFPPLRQAAKRCHQFKNTTMRKIPLSVLLTIFLSFSYGQKIEYSIPSEVENDISKDNYKKIVDIAVPIVQSKFKIEFVKAGTIQLAKDQGIKAFNLGNLVLKCVDVKDKTLWKDVIQDHFNQIFISIDERKKIDPNNFETIQKYLSIRIYPKETILQRGGIEKMVLKTDLENTYTLLMLDLPGAFTNVDRKMFDLWRKDISEVFEIAQANINKQSVEKVTQIFNIGGSEIEVSFIGDENYAASYALDLPNNSPELIGEWGSIIAIPNKGLVDICKISKDKPLDFVKFIERTKPMIEKSFIEHPQPISNDYFWYYKGRFTKVNIQTDSKGKINVIAPLGLAELMTTNK